MSSGHYDLDEKQDEKPIRREEQRQLDLLMADPKFQKALRAYTQEDDVHDVAYLAGSEYDGKTIDFDRHFAAAIEAGKVKLGGKPYDPRPFIRIHEAVEGSILREQFSPGVWHLKTEPTSTDYQIAHRIATIAERLAVEHALGQDAWNEYEDSVEPFIKQDEAEQIKNPPPDILRQPYEGSPLYAKMCPGQACGQQQSGDQIGTAGPEAGFTGSDQDGGPLGAQATGDQIGISGWEQNGAHHGKRGRQYGDASDSGMAQNAEGGTSYGARMKLTAAARKRIPAHNFALPGGRYPIEDISHARAALSMDHNATPAERVTIEHKVHLKYPSIGKQAGDRGGDSAGGVMGQYGARMEIDGNQGGGQYGARMRMKKAAGGAGDVGKARMRPILSTLAAFGHQGGPKAKGSPQFGARMAGTQATGARMPAVHPRMHALAMASATHLRNLGHLSDAQHEQIHMQATRHLQAGKTLNKAPGVTKQASPFGTLAPQAPSPGAPAGALGAIGSGVGSSMASGTQPTAPSYSPGLRQGRVQPPWERG